jgi:hypothetical protein
MRPAGLRAARQATTHRVIASATARGIPRGGGARGTARQATTHRVIATATASGTPVANGARGTAGQAAHRAAGGSVGG